MLLIVSLLLLLAWLKAIERLDTAARQKGRQSGDRR